MTLSNLLRRFTRTLLCVAALGSAVPAMPHSVGQIQSTKYFDPVTIQDLKTKIQAGQAVLQTGDTLSYILQFTPVGNGASTGVAGYITDYLPPGVEVVGAQIVRPDGAGGFSAVAPNLPGGIDNGWGRTQNTFLSPFSSSSYDTTGRCAANSKTNNCNARLTELHADTGIFFSSDPRTAQFPALPTRIAQGTNGYVINPTGANNLNGLLGQTTATTHNLWDADQTNAFGSSASPTGTPRSSQVPLTGGTGATPYYAGSVVAGPQTGYPLDNTAQIGPWQRIAYPGSRIGDASTGPALTTGGETTAIGGLPTSLGWALSAANPLPANTNAVRFAIGKIVVGQDLYARISIRLTAPPPPEGLFNSFEVFGGDAGDANDGKDSPWRYHVPSVADTNSNLYVFKEVIGFCSAGSVAAAATCSPTASASNGAIVPEGVGKFRYRITYFNSGNQTQTNVQLDDVLPFNADVKTVQAGNIYVLSGSDVRNATVGAQNLSNNSAAAGEPRGADVAPTALSTTNSRQTANFQTLALLAPGAGGAVDIDVVVDSLNADDTVSNEARITSTDLLGGVRSVFSSSVTKAASLAVSKTTSTPTIGPGGTASYTLTVTNVGSAAADTIVVHDLLPFVGATADGTRRFSYVAGSSAVSGLGAVTPTTSIPPTAPGYTANTNQQQVTWTFPTTTALAAGASFTISFQAQAGVNMPSSASGYTNDARVTFQTVGAAIDLAAIATLAAPVKITAPLSVSKTIDCVYNADGTVCSAYTGSGSAPTNTKVRFKLAYANTGATAQTDVQLCDQITSTQSSPAFTAAISVPAIAPTPSGPYTATAPPDGPPGAPSTPAPGACNFGAGGVTFGWPVIASLAAGASGAVYYDIATNASNGATITNTGKIVSAQTLGGSDSIVAFSARDNAKLVISKTTSTPTIAVGGVATYTVTVSNIGNLPAGNIRIRDELPFTGTVLDATRRFNYVAGSAVFGGSITAVAPTVNTPPTQSPYSGNANQQEVLWDFGAQTLAPGASFTITFQAQAGSNLLAGSTQYPNTVLAIYASGPNTVYEGVANAALVTIPTHLSVTKTIECVYSGSTCVPYDGTGIVPTNAKLRYRLQYANTGTVAQTNVHVCDRLPTQVVGFSAVGEVVSAPTLGAPVSPAHANCGLAATSFSFPPIASLAAGATGYALYDVQTNAASSATILNTGKIVSAQAPGGESTTVTAVAYDVAKLVISKTTSTPSILTGGQASYTITVTNNGNLATTSLKIADFLPFSGSTVDATKRFTYAATGALTGGLPAPTVTTSVPPTISPYNANANQQQVKWDFGTFSLAAGASVSVTFTADVGSSMPAANYTNSAFAEFTSSNGSGNVSINNTAPIAVSPPTPSLMFSKTVQVVSDPVNGAVNPKFIPGALADYTLTLTNSGPGAVDINTLVLSDAIPGNVELFVGGVPYVFTAGATDLTCAFVALSDLADCIAFSNDPLAVTDPAKNWSYVPSGTYDPLVRHVRFRPLGAMAANTGTPPTMTLVLRVRVK